MTFFHKQYLHQMQANNSASKNTFVQIRYCCSSILSTQEGNPGFSTEPPVLIGFQPHRLRNNIVIAKEINYSWYGNVKWEITGFDYTTQGYEDINRRRPWASHRAWVVSHGKRWGFVTKKGWPEIHGWVTAWSMGKRRASRYAKQPRPLWRWFALGKAILHVTFGDDIHDNVAILDASIFVTDRFMSISSICHLYIGLPIGPAIWCDQEVYHEGLKFHFLKEIVDFFIGCVIRHVSHINA